MAKIIARFILLMVLCASSIFGAWLAGAEPSGWTWVLAVVFSAVLVGGIEVHNRNP
jgi:hypothetical protein